MTKREEIVITDQVYDAVVQATEEGHLNDQESGGSLLSLEDQQGTVLAYALPSGPGPDVGPYHIRTDAGYQSAAMARVQRRFPALRYAGDWHIHPMWLPSLSATDRETARVILRTEPVQRDRIVLLLGTWQPERGPVLLCFVGRLDADELLILEEAALRVVHREDAELRERVGAVLPALGDLLTDPEPEPVLHRGAERIRRELEEIRGTLEASAELWVNDGGLYACVRRGAAQAVVLFPTEYPMGAPRVFAGSPRLFLEPIPLPYGWSSAHRLVDVVALALRPPLRRAVDRAKFTLRLSAHWLRRSLLTLPEELR